MKDKNLIISTVRGIAIILVVYGHMIQRSLDPLGQDFFENPVFKIIYSFHMPLFIFLSGYVMAYSLKRRTIFDTFKTRAKTLLVPFITWSILGVITAYFLNMIDGQAVNIEFFPQTLANDLFLNPVIWILTTLFISSCMLLYSVKLEKRLGKIAFFLVYFPVLLIPYNDYCSLFYIKWFYLFYAAGYFSNKYGIKITDRSVGNIVLFISLILFAVLVSFWTKNDYIYINKMKFISANIFYDLSRIFYRYITGFLGIIVVFFIGSYLLRTKLQHALDHIGSYSLDIYLIQRYLVEGLYPRFAHKIHSGFDLSSPLYLYLAAPLLSIVLVYICLLISNALIRKNSLLNKLLLGGR